MGETVTLSADSRGFSRITIDRPDRKNAFDAPLIADLTAAVGRVDRSARAVVLQSEGDTFCAGADIAVASTDATFAFTETRLGILPAVVSPYVVRKIGPARATALFVTGSRIEAKRALEIGLVERLVEPSDLDAAVSRVLDAILSGGPKAVNAAKRLVREVEGRPIDEVADLTVKRIADIRVSQEGQEGLRAFLERRDPRW